MREYRNGRAVRFPEEETGAYEPTLQVNDRYVV
jgi:hypothetical protein